MAKYYLCFFTFFVYKIWYFDTGVLSLLKKQAWKHYALRICSRKKG